MSEPGDPRLLALASGGYRRIAGMSRELAGAVRETADARSHLRLATDIVLFRALRLWPRLGAKARRRHIRVHGARLSYRLNRGDIQGIREVWIDRIYRIPPPHAIRIVVDLGTNIGLTSVWLAHEYEVALVIGVEPDPTNVDLARHNFAINGVRGTVLHAAIGPSDGVARFATTGRASNLGRVGATGEAVAQISMHTVLAELDSDQHIDLLKLDIEGGERELLLGEDLSWLERVDAIIAEFHPERVDVEQLVEALKAQGFDYIPTGALWPGSMDIFRKPFSR